MKLLAHPAIASLGLTQLYLLSGTARLEAPDRLYVYHWSGSAASLFLPTLLIFCLTWLALTLLLRFARTSARYGAAIWAVLLLPVPFEIVRCCSMLINRNLDSVIVAVLCGLVLAPLAIVAVSGRAGLSQRFESVRRGAETMLRFVAIIALLNLGQIAWSAWKARNLDAAPVLHHREPGATARPRIVWILLDELSYQQVYGGRYPGLRLPAFDQFAQQATVFTSTIAAGNKTDRVVPSLFTGGQVDQIRSSPDGHQLFVHRSDLHAWTRFDPRQTVFADALSRGYSTAVAGWYNPYCRIMPEVLDQCFWVFNTPSVGPLSPHYSVYGNVQQSLVHKISFVTHLIGWMRGSPVFDREEMKLHQLDYMLLSAESARLVKDPSATFVLLHLPVPHPHGIYDRSTGRFATTLTTYIDNLALADKTLARLRAGMEENGTWDSATVIVMGDHSWRTYMWDSQPSWTQEEQRASEGGRFDPRPAYMVKLPHQQQGARIDVPYAAVNTRALLDAVMDSRIQSPTDLARWVAGMQRPASAVGR